MWYFILILCLVELTSQQQRVAPGVPPVQYQGQPVPGQQQVPIQNQQYQHQVPVQHQVPIQNQQYQHQMPVQQQQQQVPIQNQQYQQQAPIQQVPVQQQQHQEHHPHSQMQPGQILNAANMAHEKDHIAEHLSVPIDTSKMSEQELQFHYFKMHDADNNNKLDGCELIKSLIHWHEQGHKDPMNPNAQSQEKIFQDEELTNLIDPIFGVDDSNNDGYIDYPEFVHAQQKAAAKPTP